MIGASPGGVAATRVGTAGERDDESPPSSPPAPTVPPPPSKLPAKYVYALVGSALVLLLAFIVADRLLASTPPAAPSSSLAVPAVPDGQRAPAGQPTLHASLSAYLDLHRLAGRVAPPISLVDAATGAPVTLRSLRGHVVVLTFANAACNDICPVLGTELSEAAAQLGRTKTPVTFVTVNSDPLDLSTGGRLAILENPSFAHVPSWRFLTGSVTQLNKVWVDYGISINADLANGTATHNDAMYFVDARGRLAWSASLWADESAHGTYSLPPASIARFAQGIAHYADVLAGRP